MTVNGIACRTSYRDGGAKADKECSVERVQYMRSEFTRRTDYLVELKPRYVLPRRGTSMARSLL